ncbi:hypothetical protein T439DRAFT_328776 [Meredithblackwellia eburnea MCA 4105]
MMGLLDKTLGAILTGTWVNIMCFTVEMILTWRYFTRYRDGILVVGPVILALASDTLSTASEMCSVYLYTIKHWGDIRYLLAQPITSSIWLVTTGVSAVITQLFLTVRVVRLTTNRAAQIVLGVSLAALSFSSLASTIWATKLLNEYPNYSDRNKLKRSVTTWLVLSVAADISITSSLVYQIWAVQRKHHVEFDSKLVGIINKLVIRTIETGCATTTVAVIALVVYLNDLEGNVSVGIGYSLGRFYTISMLLSLLGRQSDFRQNHLDASHERSTSGKSTFSRRPNAARAVERIQVSHSSIIHVEESVQMDGLSPGRRPGTAEAKPYTLGGGDYKEKSDGNAHMDV